MSRRSVALPLLLFFGICVPGSSLYATTRLQTICAQPTCHSSADCTTGTTCVFDRAAIIQRGTVCGTNQSTSYCLSSQDVACLGSSECLRQSIISDGSGVTDAAADTRTAPPTSFCCKCHTSTNSVHYCITSNTLETQDCAHLTQSDTFRGATMNAALTNFTCEPSALSDTQCQTQERSPTASVCGRGPMTISQLGVEAGAHGPLPQTPTSTETPFRPIVPALSVPIPGLTFTPASREGNNVNVPYIGQYIGSWYRFLTTISVTAAIIMVVWGGFRYLVGSTMSDAKAGRSIISDALIGMILVFGAYTILYVISPDTLTLKALQFLHIDEVDIQPIQLTTHVQTGGHISGDQSCSNIPANCPIPDLPPPNANCGNDHPLSESDKRINNPRAVAFRERISSLLHSSSPGARTVEVAELAVKCGLHLGSCGTSALDIQQMAGARSVSILNNSALVNHFKAPMCFDPGCRKIENCTPTPASTLVAEARGMVQGTQNATADDLQPGDWIQMFNANPSCGGGHSVIFLRWLDRQSGMAITSSGQWGTHVVENSYCLKTGCGNFHPIYRVLRPR